MATNNATNNFIDIVSKTSVTASTMADLYLVNQSSSLEKSSLGQMYDLTMGQNSAPAIYTTTQTLTAPLQNYIICNSSSGFTLTLPKLNGNARYGQPFIFNNINTGTVTIKNNAGTTLFTIVGGQIAHSFVSFIDTTSGGADTLFIYQVASASFANPGTLVYYTGTTMATIAGVTINNVGAIGSINSTKQPLIAAYVSANIGGVTGDGTHYTVPFDTVNVNNGGSYNSSTGIFTALNAGNFMFLGQVVFSNVQGGNTAGILNFPFTNRTYQVMPCNLANIKDANNNATLPFSIINSMAAGDTVYVVAIASGSSKVVGINGSGSPLSYIGIYMLS